MKEATKTIILDTARKVFAEKGFAGTRMREIAERAGINKGLLHYYFKTKKALFNAAFFEVFDTVAPQLDEIFAEKDMDVLTKFDRFVDHYMEALIRHPGYVAHVLCELHANPNSFVEALVRQKDLPNPKPFLAQMRREAKAGKIKNTDPVQLLISVISLCAFPFVARPLMQHIFDAKPEKFDAILRARKKWVKQFVREALLP